VTRQRFEEVYRRIEAAVSGRESATDLDIQVLFDRYMRNVKRSQITEQVVK
jgi:hypothetical protein